MFSAVYLKVDYSTFIFTPLKKGAGASPRLSGV
jgi:hypothetical protein